jgi:hypothetical protein
LLSNWQSIDKNILIYVKFGKRSQPEGDQMRRAMDLSPNETAGAWRSAPATDLVAENMARQ